MDRYQRVEKLKVETQIDGSRSQKQRQIDENENEIRITSQGRMCNYITYAMTLLQPYRLDERERVEAIGGWITNRYGSDCLGGLGTSRSIAQIQYGAGHQHLKPYMICEPEVTVSKRTESDNFLIIVSDGLWDVVSNEVACDVVTKCFEEKLRKGFAEGKAAAEAASMLAGLALCKGSKDNISVIVVELSKAS
ncbi:probable protein phosphatase 2C 8 isoform X4 [Actinidia eriantha]|uniref:probable protein phosphatase 2C 8 isoform X4 n=1 Tax=Actinidia eriantha TaxID=165200 RepID=UPI0025838040|nr:probable protein phosphatase 2C 8 isoform X4 [Actinidia eriantha]